MPDEFCVVIMPFSEDLKPVYEDAIKPAVEATQLKCLRVDEISGTGNIVRSIVECVHEAKVVIADLTGRNANVFYELGMAHALGNNVITLAQDIKRDVPFDVAGYKVIEYSMKWRGDRDLMGQLEKAIKTLDVWAKKPSNPVQDFLPETARPVPYGRYQKLQDKLREYEQQIDRLHAEGEAIKSEAAMLRKEKRMLEESQKETESLKQENAQLQGMKKFMEAMTRFMQQEMPEFGAGTDFEDEFGRFMQELSSQGEVTVSVVPPEGHANSSGNDAKIQFRPAKPGGTARR